VQTTFGEVSIQINTDDSARSFGPGQVKNARFAPQENCVLMSPASYDEAGTIMHIEQIKHERAGGLDAIEARNALRAEHFLRLSEDIPLWRFREVLIKLGTELGLSGGAVVYALDLLGLLTEADWRGDGRAVTYHSVRVYARKVGKSERTICGYERQLIAAGLAHRTVKHARRHNGMGNEARRTGLDWRSFGARLPELLILLEQRKAEEQRRLDLEARIRTSRRIVLGLIEALVDREGEGAVAAIAQDYARADVSRLRNTMTMVDLERRIAALVVLQGSLVEKLHSQAEESDVDNQGFPAQAVIQSEDSVRLINITNISSCPTDIRNINGTNRNKNQTCSSKRPNGRHSLEISSSGLRQTSSQYAEGSTDGAARKIQNTDTLPSLPNIWKAAPDSWKAALGSEVDISWPILIDLAQHFVPRLGVSAHAWRGAVDTLGPSEAALALIVLDRNRDHPTRPVRSVGGALVGMVRRAEQGAFNLAPSVFGILTRSGNADSGADGEARYP